MTEALTLFELFLEDAPRLFGELPLYSPSCPEDWQSPALHRIPLLRLVPVSPPASRSWILARLQAFTPDGLAPSSSSHINAVALRSGLLLWHDYLNASHELAQRIEGEGPHRLGDYWHAILHRREADYANAKYWFQRIGRPPIFGALRSGAAEILKACRSSVASRWREKVDSNTGWDPFAFVDLCAACADDEESELALAARRIQLAEMALLLEFTFHQF